MRHLALFALLTACLACNTANNDDGGDAEAANRGWRAVSAAMGQAQTDFAAEVQEGAPGDITVACAQGGTARIEGQTAAETFEFTIDLQACQVDGVEINGALSASGHATPGQVDFQYTGDLTFSGAVDLACVVDVSGRTSASVSGSTVAAQAEFHGSICGVDASVAASA